MLANVDDLGASDAKRLGEFVERGGGLLVFTGDRVSARKRGRSSRRPAWAWAKVLGPATATELPWRLERWEAGHPVFKPFADPEHGDLRRPVFTSITRIKPDPASPGAGVVPGRRARAPGADQGPGQGPLVHLGLRPRLGRLAARPDVPAHGPSDVAYVAGLAEGGRIRQEIAGDERKPGIVETDGLVHVVNPDPLESETARCTPDEFAGRFGFNLPAPGGGGCGRADTTGIADDACEATRSGPGWH